MTLADEKYLAFTTFERDGNPVTTAVWAAPVDGAKIGFWTSSTSGKAQRLGHLAKIGGFVKRKKQPYGGRGVLVTLS